MRRASFDFAESVVLVTGAGSGIGRGIALAFMEAGAAVVVTGRTQSTLDETLAGRPGDLAVAITSDVSDAASVGTLVDRVLDRFGRLDVVISNAAVYAAGPLIEMTPEAWETMRGSNIDGFVNLAQATLPHLVESGGTLVAVSSVSGERGDWGQAAYNATKATVSNFVRSLALDYGDRGVRINAVAPSFTLTELTRHMAESEEILAPFVNRVALGRPGHPEDIAPAVLFLASEAARYITGVVLPVDGGTMASTGQPHIDAG